MKKPPHITLYSTRQCSHCRQAKAFLRKHKIPFVELDVERNKRAFVQFQRAGGRGVPLIIIDKKTYNGFDPKQLAKGLKQVGFDV